MDWPEVGQDRFNRSQVRTGTGNALINSSCLSVGAVSLEASKYLRQQHKKESVILESELLFMRGFP